MGHLLEAAPLPDGSGWTSGRSNVHALWLFVPARPDAAAGPLLVSGAPLELRTLLDLTADAQGWLPHADCGVSTYRGALPGGSFYEVCDGGVEVYVAPARDLRAADRALLATERLPGPRADADAFLVRLHGVDYAFEGASSASSVVLRQARFVPLGPEPATVRIPEAALLSVRLHDVVAP